MQVTCPHCFQNHEVPFVLTNKLRTFERYLSPEAQAIYARTLPTTLRDGSPHIDVCPVCDEPLESGIKKVEMLEDQLSQQELKRQSKEWSTTRVVTPDEHGKVRKHDVVAHGQLSNVGVDVAPERKARFVETQAEPHDHARRYPQTIVKVRAVSFAPVFERVLVDTNMVTMDETDTGLPESYVKAAAAAFDRLVKEGMLRYGMVSQAIAVPLATANDLRYRQAVVFIGFSHLTLDELNTILGGRFFVLDGGLGTNDWRPLLEAVGELPVYKHSVEEVEQIVKDNAQEVGRGTPSAPVQGRDL